MLNPIFKLFGQSPFASLKLHMEQVARCVHLVPELFITLEKREDERLQELTTLVSHLEHQADLIKNDIRNHLPKTLFLPVRRGDLLEILALQDQIADHSEDIAVLLALKKVALPDPIKQLFHTFLTKNVETFNSAHRIIKELEELIEVSFGGVEAQKVNLMVEEVAFREHEVDLSQREMLKQFYCLEKEFSFGDFYLWMKIFEATAALSNLSENLAYRVRMTLELK